MKFTLVIFGIVAFASLAYGLSKMDIINAIQECKKQHNCDENLGDELRQNHLPKTKEGLESMYCACQKIGMITADNKVNPEVMTEVLEKMGVLDPAQITAACQSKCTGSNHVVAAKSLISCVQTETRLLGM